MRPRITAAHRSAWRARRGVLPGRQDAVVQSVGPAVSVVIPAYQAAATLEGAARSVLDQALDAPFEVIVVASGPVPELPTEDRRLRVLRSSDRLSAATARNRGVDAASGALLVFTDADVSAPAGWLAALVGASEAGGHRCVIAGAVANGTPRSASGTAEHLVQFSSLRPGAPDPGHGATANLLVPRAVWAELGPFPEDMGGGEDTLLTRRARATGRFRFAPSVVIVHHNRTDFRAVLSHQRAFGAFTAHLADRCADLPHRWLLRRPLLVPIAVCVRAVAVVGRAPATFGSAGALVRGLPALAVAIAAVGAWGAGLAGELRAMRRRAAMG